MGNFCATDIYKEVKEQNPEEFEKFLVGQEVKKTLADQVTSVKTKVLTTADSIQKENLGVIDSKEAEVKAQFQKAKGQVNDYYLGGVKGLEQTKQQKVQDLLGYTAIHRQFEEIRKNVTDSFKIEKDRTEAQLAVIQKEATDKVSSSNHSKLSMFDTLSDKLKEEVYQSGVKEYKDKIDAQSKQFLTPLQQKLNVDTFVNRFKNFLPVDGLKTLTNASKHDINNHLQTLIGAPEEGRAVLG